MLCYMRRKLRSDLVGMSWRILQRQAARDWPIPTWGSRRLWTRLLTRRNISRCLSTSRLAQLTGYGLEAKPKTTIGATIQYSRSFRAVSIRVEQLCSGSAQLQRRPLILRITQGLG